MQEEVDVNMMELFGIAGEYARWASGPILDPTTNHFMGIYQVRQRDVASQEWINSFDFYAAIWDIGCKTLLAKHKLTASITDACPNLNKYEPGDGAKYAFFGANCRVPSGAFELHLINKKFS